jgi:hypothetical protein
MARLRVPKFPETITAIVDTAGPLLIDLEDVRNNYVATYRLDTVALRRVVTAKLAQAPANTATPLGTPAKKRGRAHKAKAQPATGYPEAAERSLSRIEDGAL